MNLENRRNKRKKQTAEIFTPPSLVNDMLNKLSEYGPEFWKESPENNCLDPSCGNGNFLIEILKRKLELNHNPLSALKTIYGLDIMKDNIAECRIRLLNLISKYEEITKEHIKIVFQNIRFLSTKIYPKGTLSYDMSFDDDIDEDAIKTWKKNIKDILQKEASELVDSLPVGKYHNDKKHVVVKEKKYKKRSKKVENIDLFQ